MKGTSRLRGSTLVGLAALLTWGIALPYGVHRELGGDYRVLLHLGTLHAHPEVLQGAPRVPGHGIDGQFFAALATDPLLLRPETPGMFDAPYYRAGRIGLPLLAWIVALGRPGPAIFVYQLLCWGLGALLAWVLARWLEDEGHSPLRAAPAALFGGVVASMFTSLPDAAMATLVAFALWRHAIGRRGALPALVLAVLVKETAAIAALAIAASELRDRRFGRALRFGLLPVLAILAWRGFVLLRLGTPPTNPWQITGQAAFAWPLAWAATKLSMPFDWMEAVALAGVGLGFLGTVALVPSILRARAPELAYGGFALLGLFLSRHVYLPHWWNHARVLLALPALAVVLAERQPPGWRRFLLRVVTLSAAVVGAPWLNVWGLGFLAVLMAAWFVRGARDGAELAR